MNEQTDESIRKYGKKVNVNGWQAKVYRWAMKKEPRFRGYCPFFWAVWGCILLAPFIGFGRLVGAFFNWIDDTFYAKYKDYKRDKKQQSDENFLKTLPPDYILVQLYELWPSDKTFMQCWSPIWDNLGSRYSYWAEYNQVEWRQHYPAAKARMEKIRTQQDILSQKNRQRAEVLVKFAKPTLYVIGAIALLYTIQGIWFLASLWSSTWVWTQVVQIAKVLGIFSGVALFLFILFCALKGVALLCDKMTYQGNFFNDVILAGIKETFRFIKETVKMFYLKECPLIEWGDETSKITKRK